jgi:hypothetical protein
MGFRRPLGLRRGSAATRLLGLELRMLPRAWMSVSCECCVLYKVEVSASVWSLVQRSPTDIWRVWVWFWDLDYYEALVYYGLMRHGEKERKMSLEFKKKLVISCLKFAPPFSFTFEKSFTAWSWDGTIWNTELAPVWMCNNYDVLWNTQVTHTHTHTHTHTRTHTLTRVANRISHFMHILLANKKEILEIKDYMYVTAFYWCPFKEVIL